MFESGSYRSLPEHTALYEALEASMDRENREEFMDATAKSRKRCHDDQDPLPHPPKYSDQSKKKRHLLLNSIKLRRPQLRNDMHLSYSDDTDADHLSKIKTRPDWLKPILKKKRTETYKTRWMEECHLLLTDKIDLTNPEGNRVMLDVSKPLPLGGPPGDKERRSALSISKLKAAYYQEFGLDELVPSLWIESERDYDISIAPRIAHWADNQDYKISEADFKNLHPNDFEDLYLLHLQCKLNHLSGSDKVTLFNAVNLWIRNIIIKHHMEDLQLVSIPNHSLLHSNANHQSSLDFPSQPRWDITTIVVPEIEAANFEIKHGLLTLVQNKQFFGHDKEDLHAHIRYFNKITSTLRYPNVPTTSIKLMLFPFSLEGAARIWLEKEPPRSIQTWDDLVAKFINQFFPPSKTTNLRNEITNFKQRFDESFSEAWDRFKDLLRACPHHGFSELHQLDTFYNALNVNDQDSLNSAAGGNFLDKRPADCSSIIESKSKVRNSRSKAIVAKVSTSASTSGVSPDVAELKDMVRALLLDKQTSPVPIPAPAPVKAVEQSCVTCGGAHSYRNCPATDSNNYRDNIQEYVSQAAAANFNQGNSGYRPPPMANQIRPPELDECLALADLGASINLMPLSVFEKLNLQGLTKTKMILELADRSISTPTGIAEDVFVKESAVQVDFIDIACEEYSQEVLGFSEVLANGNSTPYFEPIMMMPNVDPRMDILFLKLPNSGAFITTSHNMQNYFPEVRKELKNCEAKTDVTSIDETSRDLSVGENRSHKGVAVPQASHRLETLRYQGYPLRDELDPKEINEKFPLETLSSIAALDSSTPWFADIANYHAGNFVIKGMSSQQKRKFFKEVKHLFWEDPLMFKSVSDQVFDVVFLESKPMTSSLACHDGPTGGSSGSNYNSKKKSWIRILLATI
ncbi:reverse transcriptase domain-containing protein [Tanacetum coccineum]|uniref:Reverse transcriptase domain-containing protein n=1 Tax=Tanacetum coccineum TaxID=301880 RepID=A0ABQ5AI72_9ASTR